MLSKPQSFIKNRNKQIKDDVSKLKFTLRWMAKQYNSLFFKVLKTKKNQALNFLSEIFVGKDRCYKT